MYASHRSNRKASMAVSTNERARILIVEDEPIVAADLLASLEGLGYEVVGIADTGAKAVQAAERCSPDVVLMDIGLTGSMDGIAAAGEIGRQGNTAVVFVTGNTNDETLLQAGATRP